MIDRAAIEPVMLPRAAALLRLLRDGDAPIAAEAHWLLMLERYRPKSSSTAELAATLPLTLQLQRDAGTCFGASFSIADTSNAAKFVAKSD